MLKLHHFSQQVQIGIKVGKIRKIPTQHFLLQQIRNSGNFQARSNLAGNNLF